MEPGPQEQGDNRTVPWSATFSMSTLRSLAMKPMTEKMTKPAKMLVALLVQVTISVSLGGGPVCHQLRFVRRKGQGRDTPLCWWAPVPTPVSTQVLAVGRSCSLLFTRKRTA